MQLTDRDIKRLTGVHPSLVAVIYRAAELTKRPFFISEGVRTKERQADLWAIGRTKEPIGKQFEVTWTQNSKHMIQADGHGHAVDAYPTPDAGMPISKIPLKWYDEVSQAMFAAAKELGVAIKWGADWDRDGKLREKGEHDSPHYELV